MTLSYRKILTGLICGVCGCHLEGIARVQNGYQTITSLSHVREDALTAPKTSEFCSGRQDAIDDAIIEAAKPTDEAA